jgi:hypothetical protein
MRHSLRKYTTAEEVFNRVSASLKGYFDSDMVITDEYYKVIDLCNSRMGLRINPTKEALIKVSNGSAELPIDFLLLDLALAVMSETFTSLNPTIKREYLTGECPTFCDIAQAGKCCNFNLECGKKPVLTCEYEDMKIEFQQTYITRLTEKKYCTSECANFNGNSPYLMEISNNQMFVDFISDGYIYIQYISAMKGEGNIPTCLDNEIILNYYEQAIKYEILQDLYINKKLEIANALQLVEKRLILAKNEAISLTSTPEFGELININNMLKREFRKRNYFIY